MEIIAKANARRRPTHPGALLEEAVAATGLPRTEVAVRLGISRQYLYDLIDQKKPVSATVAARLGRFFGNGGGIWLRMQAAHDLWDAEQDKDVRKVKLLQGV
jgi:addiction module HigA family antidote